MYRRISIAEADDLVRNQSAVLVDIRDPLSFENGHMPDALHLTNENFEEFLNTSDKQKPVVVVCYHGNSSQQAAQVIEQQGFAQVFSMDGGYEAWKLQAD